MPLPLVFLDIDGVLNSSLFFLRNPTAMRDDVLDIVACKRLEDLVVRTRARVVISSTWRLSMPLRKIQVALTASGFERSRYVVGTTPSIPDAQRGDEIARWLELMEMTDVPFVVFDDDADMDAVSDKLVRTDCEVGLQDVDVAKALQLLRNQGVTPVW